MVPQAHVRALRVDLVPIIQYRKPLRRHEPALGDVHERPQCVVRQPVDGCQAGQRHEPPPESERKQVSFRMFDAQIRRRSGKATAHQGADCLEAIALPPGPPRRLHLVDHRQVLLLQHHLGRGLSSLSPGSRRDRLRLAR